VSVRRGGGLSPVGRPLWRHPVVAGLVAAIWLLLMVQALMTREQGLEIALDLLAFLLGPGALLLVSLRSQRRTRSSLSRAELQLEVVAASTDAVPWECDTGGRLTFIGSRRAGRLGYPLAELADLTLHEVAHPQEHARLAALLTAGTGWKPETWRCLHQDGTERWFTVSAVPRLAPDGRLLGFTGSSSPLGSEALGERRRGEITHRVNARLASGAVTPVFQPILSVDTGQLIGAEALSRFVDSDRNPEQWFKDAAEVGLSVELELLALRTALAAAHTLPHDIYVSVNVGPPTLVDQALRRAILDSGFAMDRLVLEITEHASITDYEEVLAAVRALRAAGARVAVDDAGAGYASFRHILRLTPQFIKLDRSLVAGLDRDPALRALAAAVVTFGNELGASVIAEGIETSGELDSARALGINAGQGYLLGKPTDDLASWARAHAQSPLWSAQRRAAAPARGGSGRLRTGRRQG
jgi:EAL domain-containing protein (putative c-di-GMP-specific phosphodiesterase class I)/PAS domain-containing protein